MIHSFLSDWSFEGVYSGCEVKSDERVAEKASVAGVMTYGMVTAELVGESLRDNPQPSPKCHA